MLRLILSLIGLLVPVLGIILFLSELVAIVAGILLLVTLSWQNLLSSTDVQLRLLLATGLMTLGVGQFALISFLLNYSSPLRESLSDEEDERPVFILPSSEFFTHGSKRRRRQRNK
jgi:hypothetical protein